MQPLQFQFRHSLRRGKNQAFSLMELLVVIAIIIILASIAFPVWQNIQKQGFKTEASNRMKNLVAGGLKYAQEHDGVLPDEDITTADSWDGAALDTSTKVWYNALPRAMNAKGVGDFVRMGTPAAFYTKENVIYLPGAQYPKARIMTRPYFAMAINTKLQRKNPVDTSEPKREVKISNIKIPTRTVYFLEQGMPGEEPSHPTQTSGDYDGSCKGSAKSFVARYSKKGLLAFIDGHIEEVGAKDLLDEMGAIRWDVNSPSNVFWTPDNEENPNRSTSSGTGSTGSVAK